ncbi:ATP-binding cassette domain-containing protein [Brevibacterium album]|uniref:ATP-binding cassette domain-containing protein n=1 Tax=Brevibacterium album TaxID=417948 RepID=UPI0004176D20|nr:ATP-binding cassette domain-containing protein [Brevibacterium album]
MTTGPILAVRELSKTFTMHSVGGRRVVSLERVGLDVAPGEHVALAGSSGAGKSSLLRCICRTYLPDSGTVVLDTAAGTGLPPAPVELTALGDRAMARLRGREIGYVSQFLQARPRTGPRAHVREAALRRGMPAVEADERAVAALRGLGIAEELFDIDCAVLSGGERQRINLAAGIVSPPRLLLLDEPVSALDPANRERALALIEELTARDVAVLAVYHSMSIIRRLADRVVVMEHGRVVDDASAESVLSADHSALKEAYA